MSDEYPGDESQPEERDREPADPTDTDRVEGLAGKDSAEGPAEAIAGTGDRGETDSTGPREPPPLRPGRRGRGTRAMDPDRPCMNCGDPTPGEYCPTCGQRKVDVQVSVKTLMMDVMEDQFILDKRLPRTLSSLLFRPGHMTVEYVNGRIVRFIHPFRLYLVTSLIFFLLLSFFSLRLVRRTLGEEGGALQGAVDAEDAAAIDEALRDVNVALADTALTEEQRQAARDQLAALSARRREIRVDSLDRVIASLDSAVVQIDSTLQDSSVPGPVLTALRANREGIEGRRQRATAERAAVAGDTLVGDSALARAGAETVAQLFGWDESPPTVKGLGPPAVDSALAGRIRRLGSMRPREAAETLVGTFFNYAPTLMFILLPVFAGVLKLLYIRRGRFYAEHFVFLLHVHSFVFLLATLMLLLGGPVGSMLEPILGIWLLVYIYLAMKRVYGQGWIKTFAKYWTLGWAYFWILTLAVPIAFVATILFF